MRNWLSAMIVILVVAVGAPAWAGEIVGRVQAVEPGIRVVHLEDGTQLWAEDGVNLDVQPGAKIKASYEERDGKKVLIALEIVEGP